MLRAGLCQRESALRQLPHIVAPRAQMTIRPSFPAQFSSWRATTTPVRRFFRSTALPPHFALRTQKTPPWMAQTSARRFLFGSSKTSTATASERAVRWRRLAKFVRYTRIPFLVLTVYNLGYQQGVVDYARDSFHFEQALLLSVLVDSGCKSLDDAERIPLGRPYATLTKNESPNDASQKFAVARVGHQVVQVAQAFAKTQYEQAMDTATQRLAKNPSFHRLSSHEIETQLLQDPQVELWSKAHQHMQGPWEFIIVQSQTPNAFVSELLPNRFFVTTAMMQLMTDTHHEIALVVGHELSHLLLGHVSERNQLEMALRILEVLLLSLDPTEGIVSLGVVGLLATARQALTAAHSRDHETQADELGIRLAAMACFDTYQGAEVLRKMHALNRPNNQEEEETPNKVTSFLDSHPPTLERYRRLQVLSQEENPNKYIDSHCATVGSRLRRMLLFQQQRTELPFSK